jgi:hypothetical protein
MATSAYGDNIQIVFWFISVVMMIVMRFAVALDTRAGGYGRDLACFDGIPYGLVCAISIRVFGLPPGYAFSYLLLVFSSIVPARVPAFVSTSVLLAILGRLFGSPCFYFGPALILLASQAFAIFALVFVPVYPAAVFAELCKRLDPFAFVTLLCGHRKTSCRLAVSTLV